MALIIQGKTKCSICNATLNEGDNIVMCPHFISDPNDRLWRFSDSGMHKTCFLEWEHRENFVKKYNNSIGLITWGNGTYHHMEDDGQISVLRRKV